MRNTFLTLLLALCFCTTFSQELLCNVVVNADQSGNANAPVIKTLEKQLNEFVNNTKWTNQTYKFNLADQFITHPINLRFITSTIRILPLII